MSEPLGQILPESDFGQWLTRISRDCDKIVEIGTWRGMGSTLCIANGLVRPEQLFITIEKDVARWWEAKRRHKDKRILFLRGDALNLIHLLPNKIDLLLFDGDDLTTNDEFDALKDRCLHVALDDTNETKNRRQMELLSKDDAWTLVAGNNKDRNGWAIFKRKP